MSDYRVGIGEYADETREKSFWESLSKHHTSPASASNWYLSNFIQWQVLHRNAKIYTENIWITTFLVPKYDVCIYSIGMIYHLSKITLFYFFKPSAFETLEVDIAIQFDLSSSPSVYGFKRIGKYCIPIQGNWFRMKLKCQWYQCKHHKNCRTAGQLLPYLVPLLMCIELGQYSEVVSIFRHLVNILKVCQHFEIWAKFRNTIKN